MSVGAAAILFVTVLGLMGQWLRRFGFRVLLTEIMETTVGVIKQKV